MNASLIQLLPYILFGLFAFLLIMRVPIAFCLGISAMVCLYILGYPLSVIGQRMFLSTDSFSIMAVPLFIFAGNIMTESGMSGRLIDVADSILGNVSGGLAMASILACGFFAALSGSGPATVVAIGGMIYPEMLKRGYPDYQMGGLLAVSGGLGPIIPPSIIMVIYASVTDTSTVKLFTTGFIAGGIMLVALLCVCYWQGKKHNWPKSDKKFSFKVFLLKLKDSFWALLMPVIVLGGIYTGKFTPTEAAAVSVAYSLIISLFVYKGMTMSSVFTILKDSAISSGVILFIIATSSAFSWLFTVSGISARIVSAVAVMQLGYYGVLILITIILLIFGFFMDGGATVLLLIPLFLPIALSVGIDRIHLGLIVAICNVVGCMTPPVALNIFAASSFSGLSAGKIAKGETPYLITMLGVLILVVFYPQLFLYFVR